MGDTARIEELRREFGPAFDPGITRATDSLDLPDPPPDDYSDFAQLIRDRFAATDGDTVAVRFRGTKLGVCSRASVGAAGGTLSQAEPVPVGSGDRATLPGESGQYRAIRYYCTAHDHQEFHIFHDDRIPRNCPVGAEPLEFAWT
ncbi:hypothetical protein [Actinoplanes sp. G11-F43]|uniref:hypothetical protein n=1 Tax=Actinoplanes sp. G11-F43 TaxID=3424130 RepID=UPI003D33438E